MPDGSAPPRRRMDDDALRRIAATGDPISEMHRMITGHAVRLHIPLKDAIQVREVAKALRVLASTLEAESYSKDDEWRILFRAHTAITMANRLIGKRKR